jgi:hypothetical protein
VRVQLKHSLDRSAPVRIVEPTTNFCAATTMALSVAENRSAENTLQARIIRLAAIAARIAWGAARWGGRSLLRRFGPLLGHTGLPRVHGKRAEVALLQGVRERARQDSNL